MRSCDSSPCIVRGSGMGQRRHEGALLLLSLLQTLGSSDPPSRCSLAFSSSPKWTAGSIHVKIRGRQGHSQARGSALLPLPCFRSPRCRGSLLCMAEGSGTEWKGEVSVADLVKSGRGVVAEARKLLGIQVRPGLWDLMPIPARYLPRHPSLTQCWALNNIPFQDCAPERVAAAMGELSRLGRQIAQHSAAGARTPASCLTTAYP